tara:strand:- start:35 stop:769 length:735 start_codon:yes stop_codon:yes gene_type:complete
MRVYKVNGIEHRVYDSDDLLPLGVKVIEDWRDGHVGDWVKTDDECYIQVLRRGTMYKPKGRIREVDYIGTCTGTFVVSNTVKMDSSRRVNIYSFSGSKKSDDILIDRKNLNSNEQLFVLYLTSGMDMENAYLKAFPTNNRKYAIQRASKLIRTERIKTAMKEELKPVLEELGINESSILKEIQTIATYSEKDETKLKALFKLADIMDLEDKNQTKVTQIQGVQFKGFMGEDVDKAVRPVEIEEK